MVGCVENERERQLFALRKHLQFYSATLVDWQQALDDARREISRLTPAEAAEAAEEIDGIRDSVTEFNTLKEQVDAGWALYRRLTEAPDMPVPKAFSIAIAQLAAPNWLH
jgi:hypothetical protein